MREKFSGNAKVCVETYGCTMNQSDSDIIRAVLLDCGFELADAEEADVVVINSCGVIDYTERKILKRAEELKRKGKKVVIAGCLPRISSRKVKEVADAAIGPDNLLEAGKAVLYALRGEQFFDISRVQIEKSNLKKCRLKQDKQGALAGIAIVSIAEGCTGRCTFCATRFARGRLRSFSIDAIVREVESAVKQGFVEIQLTSQDTGAYGMDRYGYYALPDLLERISEIPGDFRVRVGMMNPRHAYEMLDDLLNAFSEKIYKFIHIPVQSGDEKVLRDMGRDHGVEEYFEVVSAFRKLERKWKDTMVSTDIIVGFPTENDEAFHRTLDLIRESKPDLVNVTRYSPRRGTPAYRLRDMPEWIKKDRSRAVTRLSERIKEKRNERLLGRRFKAIVTKVRDDSLARIDSYRAVVVPRLNLGELIEVEISGFTPTHLIGSVKSG